MRMFLKLFFTLLTGAAGVRVKSLGRVSFGGLIQDLPLGSSTHSKILHAFGKADLAVAHNSHFISRLLERGPEFGIHTLNDFARGLNGGEARAHKENTVLVVFPCGKIGALFNKSGELITFLPMRET